MNKIDGPVLHDRYVISDDWEQRIQGSDFSTLYSSALIPLPRFLCPDSFALIPLLNSFAYTSTTTTNHASRVRERR
jgi:hypothetical protein